MFPGHQNTVAKWRLDSVESKEHDKAVIGMLTIDLLPMYFVCKSGYLFYSTLTSPKYEVKSEYYYRGLIDKVRFPTSCDMMPTIYEVFLDRPFGRSANTLIYFLNPFPSYCRSTSWASPSCSRRSVTTSRPPSTAPWMPGAATTTATWESFSVSPTRASLLFVELSRVHLCTF